MIRIASFDIGKKNFAQYIDEVDNKVIENLKEEYYKLPSKHKRRVKGPMNDDIENILYKLYKSSTRIQTGVYDLRQDSKSDKYDIGTRKKLIRHLESFDYLWKDCDIIVIEKQFRKKGKGKKQMEANISAIEMSESVMTWFLSTYIFKDVIYFGSENKTNILGAPLKMTKNQRKKWAIEKTKEICEIREDYSMIELFKLKDLIFRKRLDTEIKIKSYLDTYPEDCSEDCKKLAVKIVREKQKLDDISDACIQLQAYKFRHMIGCF